MNNKSYLYSYLLTLIGGILLVVLQGREGLFTGITILIGILFLIPGLTWLVRMLFPPKAEKLAGAKAPAGMIIIAAAAAIFGVLLIAVPHMFLHFMVYAFGSLLIVCGLVQLLNFMPAINSLGFPKLYLVTPILSLCIGVLIMVIGAEKILNVLALVTGIVLIVYSLNGLTGYFDRTKRLKGGGVTGKIVNVE